MPIPNEDPWDQRHRPSSAPITGCHGGGGDGAPGFHGPRVLAPAILAVLCVLFMMVR